jgi:hypothetical protein
MPVADVAEHADAMAGRQRLLHARIERKKAQHELRPRRSRRLVGQ